MQGTLCGNILGTLYFIYFQLAGVLSVCFALKREKPFAKLLLGSCFGSLLLHCLPSLFAFAFGFTVLGHIVSAAAVVPIFVIFLLQKNQFKGSFKGIGGQLWQNKGFAVMFAAFAVLWCVLLNSHIIPLAADGAVHTGQCTYGDMNMHLGFITSIAQQGTFPPQYSIFPGTKLAYPFLNAAISSSVYLFGASLRWAYILPMLGAFVQIMGLVYLLGTTVLGDGTKALFGWLLFFLNGGIGFICFTGIVADSPFTFADIFSGFYKTPTNLVEFNIRWANVIADILLPQRASLFGYAMLFAAVWLLYKAVWHNQNSCFVLAAVFSGALPLIHTHSFLAAGLISAAWLLLWLYKNSVKADKQRYSGFYCLGAFTVFMCVLQLLHSSGSFGSVHFFAVGITGMAACVLYGLWLMTKYISENSWKTLLKGWGVYLAIVLLMALPQLFCWTFGQVAEGGFLRGHFNWGNNGDFYLWFYLKNLGLPLVLIVAAICKGGKNISKLVLPAGVIWFVAELILFTPNTYDNNKLLYVAYLLLCIAAADFAVDWYRNRSGFAKKIAAVAAVALCTISALLTLGREVVSDYQLYSADHMALAAYVEENTDAEDVFLTNTRHNNEIASLTGRSVVCGSDVFLYYHGIDTSQRKAEVKQMYENPLQSAELYEKYSVDYIVVSSWEKSDYYIDIPLYSQLFTKVFEEGGATLYKVK